MDAFLEFVGPAEFMVRILVAAALGGLVGLERDMHGRAAGLRTHLLVSLGAAVFTVASVQLAEVNVLKFGAQTPADAGRVAAQIVSGIGFLGAGAILKEGLSIRGLTTAACLWVVAGIGMASGAGDYALAIGATAAALCALVFLKNFERSYPRDSYRQLTIVVPGELNVATLVEAVTDRNIVVLGVGLETDYERRLTTARISLRLYHQGLTDLLAGKVVQAIESAGIPLKSSSWELP